MRFELRLELKSILSYFEIDALFWASLLLEIWHTFISIESSICVYKAKIGFYNTWKQNDKEYHYINISVAIIE